jgi:hypothetical protein
MYEYSYRLIADFGERWRIDFDDKRIELGKKIMIIYSNFNISVFIISIILIFVIYKTVDTNQLLFSMSLAATNF